MFLGTLWSSTKEVKPPFLFDVEHGIALEEMEWNRASSCVEGESYGLPQVVGGNSCFLLSKYGDGSEPLMVSHGHQASFLVARDTLGFFSNCGWGIWRQLDLRRKYQRPFPVATAILRFV